MSIHNEPVIVLADEEDPRSRLFTTNESPDSSWLDEDNTNHDLVRQEPSVLSHLLLPDETLETARISDDLYTSIRGTFCVRMDKIAPWGPEGRNRHSGRHLDAIWSGGGEGTLCFADDLGFLAKRQHSVSVEVRLLPRKPGKPGRFVVVSTEMTLRPFITSELFPAASMVFEINSAKSHTGVTIERVMSDHSMELNATHKASEEKHKEVTAGGEAAGAKLGGKAGTSTNSEVEYRQPGGMATKIFPDGRCAETVINEPTASHKGAKARTLMGNYTQLLLIYVPDNVPFFWVGWTLSLRHTDLLARDPNLKVTRRLPLSENAASHSPDMRAGLNRVLDWMRGGKRK